tara:strand:+ start:335 stop:1300 length:966 start_codon:yes stop_codon:yes gene_type:complete
MYKIGVLPLNGFALMSYASLVEPFRAANFLSEKQYYNVINFSESKEGTVSSSGLKISGDYYIGDTPKLDILFVIAGGDPFKYDNKNLYRWINKLAQTGVTIGGVSGGPIILVKAGLMKEHRMTVHWEHSPSLLEIAHDTILEKSLYVIDRNRITCAGGTAPIDMVLAIVKKQKGTKFAQLVSDWFLHNEIRPSGGPQRSNLVNRVGTTNKFALSAIELMENHLADPLTLNQLAELNTISKRQLNRIFKKYFEKGTMEYYRELRLDKAKNLLRNSSLSIAEISHMTGFYSSSHFSSLFMNYFDNPPSKYRNRYNTDDIKSLD